jgi:hypothetical protein
MGFARGELSAAHKIVKRQRTGRKLQLRLESSGNVGTKSVFFWNHTHETSRGARPKTMPRERDMVWYSWFPATTTIA